MWNGQCLGWGQNNGTHCKTKACDKQFSNPSQDIHDPLPSIVFVGSLCLSECLSFNVWWDFHHSNCFSFNSKTGSDLYWLNSTSTSSLSDTESDDSGLTEEKASPKSFSKAHFFLLVGGEWSSLQSLIDSVVELTDAEIGVDYRQLVTIY